MYPKYQTEAIVLMSYPLKEADKAFLVWTKDFGKLHLRAAGIRKEESKLRQQASFYLKIKVTILQGKSGWRLLELADPSYPVSDFESKELQKLLSPFKLLLKLSPSFEANKKIFCILDTLLKNYREHNIDELSTAASFSILAELGYTDKGIEVFDLQNRLFLESEFQRLSADIKKQIERAYQDMQI